MIDELQQGRGSQPVLAGVVFNTSVARPDAALAIAALYMMENKRESRVGAICVAGAGFDAAVFCDVIARFYAGPAKNGNSMLAVGLVEGDARLAASPMVKAVVDRKKDTGDPQYSRSLQRISDTSQGEAVLRNGVIFNADSVVVLSAPATALARTLDLLGAKEEYIKRVKRLVIVDAGAPQQDPAALRKIVTEWPTPVFYCGRDVGDALMFAGTKLDAAFAWAPAHPVADAYRAFKAMPYDTPLHDVVGVHYAVHPDSGFFVASGPGTLNVTDAGVVSFAAGPGNVRRLTLDAAKKTQALEALIAIATAPLTRPAGRGL
jgi:purine nucleosidase